MKTANIIQLAALAAAFLICNFSQARTPEEVMRDIDRATSKAAITYKSGGMSGLIESTEKCYKSSAANKYYCVYLDIAARHIDQMVVQSMHFPPNEFFTVEALVSRVFPALVSSGMNVDTASDYVSSMEQVINGAIERKMLK